MRACSACAAPNEPTRRYCGQCAASMGWTCKRCTFANATADRFCGGCAAPADAPASLATAPKPAAHAPATRVTLAELHALIPAKPEARPAAESLPANVTQEALDRLFGANG